MFLSRVGCLVECGYEPVDAVRFATSAGPEDTRPQLLCLGFDCLAQGYNGETNEDCKCRIKWECRGI